ncbi:ribonucleoside-diphosphate reductase subunit alpha [Priestia megaterium]|uniref:ribonucleoside-diphosphate reductase subunit alpha n=1 Tax=Priestia megaterium TaxID=1404 RepID=UPI003CC62972
MTLITKDQGNRKLPFNEGRLDNFIDEIAKDFPELDMTKYKKRIKRTINAKEEYRARQITKTLILNALDNVSITETSWTFFASRIYLKELYKEAAYNRSYSAKDKYGDLYGLLKTLGKKNIYSKDILREYSEEEIKLAQSFIVPEKDKLFTYIGLFTLADRYLAKTREKEVYELPQERFLIIALALMHKEKKEARMELVKEAYWALSTLYMTVATPTLSNAGRTHGQLSSCFIDTIDDSLRSIYDSNTDISTLSKASGGIGVYLGHIRSRGSDIKGFKGVSSGVLPWMKQLNNTAVSVDQLGQRQGAIAVYLDVWHKDIFIFLDAKLNNGDERMRTHDLFTGVCLPDLFMEKVDARGDWYLFDPHEVEQVMGWRLEDCYDEEEGSGTFRERYEMCVQSNELSKEKVAAIDIFKRIMISQLETGTPYMFYRDTVNRANPNKHVEGSMIYCSNLCTEITQNQSSTELVEEKRGENDGEIVIRKKAGDFVVCNLSSIHLGNAVKDGVLPRLIKIMIRMLDNVIDHNQGRLGVLQAEITNERYRAIGLGTFDWHHLLAIKQIIWESDEAVEYADKLYEEIAYHAIKSSMELAQEKGAYPYFEGSEWETGEYFTRRGYLDQESEFDWVTLMNNVKEYGIRNGYLQSPAPNGSTSVIANGTQATYPVFNKKYYEEKKNYKLPIVLPDLNDETGLFYNNAYLTDQKWSIKQNAARQRHVDQSLSFNLYVQNDIKAKDLLDLHMTAWNEGLKTTYYVRSKALEDIIEECDSCQ